MSEEKQYKQWNFFAIPPYSGWRWPANSDVVCNENMLSIFDTNEVTRVRDEIWKDGKLFGGVVCDFFKYYLLDNQKPDMILSRMADAIRRVEPDYVVCSNLYNSDGVQYPYPVDANTILSHLGFCQRQANIKIAYNVKASALEEKHIARIYEMVRDGQIDTLVVSGQTDKISRRVIQEIEYLGIEIGAANTHYLSAA